MSDVAIEEGTTFVDTHGDTYTVEAVDAGRVHFEDFFTHWEDEVEGFVEDSLWEVDDE